MSDSFLFYDLETWGTDPGRSRIAQFAAIRTDADLNVIDEPISLFVKPADDLLPSPEAVLITGITPQAALGDGLCEADAFRVIADAMSQPGTCALGYNSLRFDDEFIRCGLYRNFFDPYEREWRGGNSRWDLLDVLRAAYALRPDGLHWPRRDDGHASFRLEHLAEANGVREGDAHEALSDVRALIGLARLLRKAQPRFWDYALRLRDKRHAATLMDTVAMQPVLHVSQRFPASRMNAAAVVPLARHPQIDSRVIVFDLHADPQSLLDLDADAIADRLFVPSHDLPEGEGRIPLKAVHLNRCPMLVAWSHLRDADFTRLQVDPVLVDERAARLRAQGPVVAEKIRRVFAAATPRPPGDVDAALYAGFLADADRRAMQAVRATPPAALGTTSFAFQDARLAELLFRYRARNWPDTLSVDEHARWNDYRRQRLLEDSGLSECTLPEYFARIAQLRGTVDAQRHLLLDQLEDWGCRINADIGTASLS